MFDAFSKADLPTLQALIQSKPDLVSLGGGSEMFDPFSKADLPTVQALILSKPDLVSLGEGVKCLMLSARLIYPHSTGLDTE